MDNKITEANVSEVVGQTSAPVEPTAQEKLSPTNIPTAPVVPVTPVNQPQAQTITTTANVKQETFDEETKEEQVADISETDVIKFDPQFTHHPMRAILANDPKIAFMIPLRDGESPDAMEYVGINGYPVYIRKGVLVEIPKHVYDILKESYNVTSAIGRDKRLDRRSDVSEALR